MKNNTLDFYNNNSKAYIENTLSVDMSHLYKFKLYTKGF